MTFIQNNKSVLLERHSALTETDEHESDNVLLQFGELVTQLLHIASAVELVM